MNYFANLEFPVLPQERYSGAAVFMEPMIGSGERIAVCAGVYNESQSLVKPIISKQVIHCMYGHAKGNRFYELIEFVSTSLSKHLETQRPFDGWSPPYQGVYLGKERNIKASSASEAILGIAKLNSSLSNLIQEEEFAEIGRSEGTLTEIKKQIRSLVLGDKLEYDIYFEQELETSEGNKEKFFFMKDESVSEVGLLLPESINAKVRDIRANILRLEHMPHLFNKRSVIVFTPKEDSIEMIKPTDRDKVLRKLNAVQEEGHKAKVDVIPVTEISVAANLLKAA
jgi:hypothetical protein